MTRAGIVLASAPSDHVGDTLGLTAAKIPAGGPGLEWLSKLIRDKPSGERVGDAS